MATRFVFVLCLILFKFVIYYISSMKFVYLSYLILFFQIYVYNFYHGEIYNIYFTSVLMKTKITSIYALEFLIIRSFHSTSFVNLYRTTNCSKFLFSFAYDYYSQLQISNYYDFLPLSSFDIVLYYY